MYIYINFFVFVFTSCIHIQLNSHSCAIAGVLQYACTTFLYANSCRHIHIYIFDYGSLGTCTYNMHTCKSTHIFMYIFMYIHIHI